eukprot:TRINITY_DN4545_c0_g1_i1.p2 TRINITY_DN4545_c0_g1~~TRINITY_DN4545_c0_g1_i1.p2  ORF type:complete len:677 (-),score=97.47 TRINITY_DN4545_c0_g1_i1:4215-6245(-)
MNLSRGQSMINFRRAKKDVEKNKKEEKRRGSTKRLVENLLSSAKGDMPAKIKPIAENTELEVNNNIKESKKDSNNIASVEPTIKDVQENVIPEKHKEDDLLENLDEKLEEFVPEQIEKEKASEFLKKNHYEEGKLVVQQEGNETISARITPSVQEPSKVELHNKLQAKDKTNEIRRSPIPIIKSASVISLKDTSQRLSKAAEAPQENKESTVPFEENIVSPPMTTTKQFKPEPKAKPVKLCKLNIKETEAEPVKLIRLKLRSKSFMERKAHAIKSSLKKQDQSHNEEHEDFDNFLELLLEKHGGYTKRTTVPRDIQIAVRRGSVEGNDRILKENDKKEAPLVINLPQISTIPFPDYVTGEDKPTRNTSSKESYKEKSSHNLAKLRNIGVSVPSSPNTSIVNIKAESRTPAHEIKIKVTPEDIPLMENKERKYLQDGLVSFEAARRNYQKNTMPQKYRPQIKVLLSNDPDTFLRDRFFLNGELNKQTKSRIKRCCTELGAYQSFKLYANKLGNPIDSRSVTKKLHPLPGATPGSVVKMGKRLGISPANDPDLMWIPHLQLSAKIEKLHTLKETCNLRIGEHPGDVYFYFLTQIEKARKTSVKGESIDNIIKKSWLPFKSDKGDDMNYYYYNFATKEISFDRPEMYFAETVSHEAVTKRGIDEVFEKAYALFQYYKVN